MIKNQYLICKLVIVKNHQGKLVDLKLEKDKDKDKLFNNNKMLKYKLIVV